MSQQVGVVGLGIMGSRMARNLVKAGYEVTAWNRTARPELDEIGARLVATPAEVGAAAPVVITMLTDAPAVLERATREGGFYAALARHERPIHVSMETIGGEHTRALAKVAAEVGITLLGAPVSGGSGGAAAGALAIMARGPHDAFEAVEPVFDVLGDPAKRAYCGPNVGAGPDLKLDNNLCLLDGLVTVFLSCLGALDAGLDPAVAYRVFLGSTGDSVAMRGRCYLPGAAPNNPVDNGFAPIYKLKDALKDLRLWADKARRLGLPCGRVQHTIDLYDEALREGWGELDFSVILNVILRRAGRPQLPTLLDRSL
ncbi:MAG: NAD(P)-dependent oxidoreductase [Armatimonadetes bacterium]|nr:NAD(P)-dependent oxidoreductase [Armatimonadota bacterium]